MPAIPSALPKDLFLLNPDIAFLNHGSFGATPKPVFEKYQWWQRELEWQPVEFLGTQRRFNGLMREAREALARFVHTAADNLVYVPNATTAMNIVARSLHFQPGDEILATNHEYGALDRCWRFLCKASGAIYTHQPIPLPVTTAEAFVEQFWAGVTPRTKVVFVSHIPSPTALIFPIKEICRRARAAGILSVIDGAHAVGQIPLDMEDLGADFYCSNLHKWANCPKGSAFLYARPDRQHLVEPLIVSWGYEAERPGASRFIDEQEFTGTRDPSAYLAVPEGLKFLADHHWDNIRLQCHALLRQARARISELTGLPPISPDTPDWFMQMCTVPLPPCDTTALKTRLYDEFGVEIPIITWQGKPYIRVSIQAYNSSDDVDRLMNGLARLLDT
jgi:isopenicillin-N epimerase